MNTFLVTSLEQQLKMFLEVLGVRKLTIEILILNLVIRETSMAL